MVCACACVCLRACLRDFMNTFAGWVCVCIFGVCCACVYVAFAFAFACRFAHLAHSYYGEFGVSQVFKIQ